MTVSRAQTQAKLDLLASGVTRHVPEQTYLVPDRFEECARQCPDKIFLHYRGQKISFFELNRRANQYAHIAATLGIKSGDVGAVMMENRPEFFYAWLGLAKIGATAALINTQVRGVALSHAIEETASNILFLGNECVSLFATVPGLGARVKTLCVADGERPVNELPTDIDTLAKYLVSVSDVNPAASCRDGIIGESPLFYVFTSGTTGLPKAAIISHMRWLGVGDGWSAVLGMTPNDVLYCVLPLFHGAAGMSLVSNALSSRAPIVLRRRFSASQFWNDVRQHGVTTVQYIGEICRYLINQPATDTDRQHSLLRITGAGMTADVWRKFIERFGDIEIYEGWGSTEANCSTMNVDGEVGSCGRIPFKGRSNARLVKYDLENNCHVKNDQGFLAECEPGEVGELLGMVLNIPGVGAGRFEGYVSVQATQKKILRNVFASGDAWFSSGDLLVRNADDYLYFVDRIGDNYRWKSENVSTTEVARALESYHQAQTINVYGVAVPEQEGRAGMLAIRLKDGCEFDPAALYEQAASTLPDYAVPLFVRILAQTHMTLTFKLRKVDLQKAGYNPANVTDPLFVLDRNKASYVPYSDSALRNLGVKPFLRTQEVCTEALH
ncbi:MAG: fatty-acyl-CoA synthase [Halioglobus sp.]|jgi:fatty-acyl-CoA synthase